MNKRQKEIYERYLRSNYTRLGECYNDWSNAKETAYWACIHRMSEQNGIRFRIISYNIMQFTIGYTYEKGTKTYFHYETAYTIKEWEVK